MGCNAAGDLQLLPCSLNDPKPMVGRLKPSLSARQWSILEQQRCKLICFGLLSAGFAGPAFHRLLDLRIIIITEHDRPSATVQHPAQDYNQKRFQKSFLRGPTCATCQRRSLYR
jgi:hypothetical protein